MIGLAIAYTVKIDTRVMILTPGQWPSQHFGDDNCGITVEAYDEDTALDIASHRTGVSRRVLIVTK